MSSFLLQVPGSLPRPLAGIICDMDGLLVDSEPLSVEAWRLTLLHYQVAMHPDDLREMFGLRIDATARLLIDRYALPITVDELSAEKSAEMEALIRVGLRPMPGATELIQWMEHHHVPHALATSGLRRHAEVSLAAAGFGHAFPIRVTGEDVLAPKPAPDAFLSAAQRLGLAPATCLVLEDAPHGVAAALAAGMAVIAVPNQQTQDLDFPAPTATARSLSDVERWLRSQDV